MGKVVVEFSVSLLYDRLHTLSVEYDIPLEQLVNLAVKRLLDDVDWLRDLRKREENLH